MQADATEQEVETNSETLGEGDDTNYRISIPDDSSESDSKKEVQLSRETKTSKVQTWSQIRSSLGIIENMMSSRVKKRKYKDELITMGGENHLQSIEKTGSLNASEEFKEEVCVTGVLNDSVNASIAENAEVDGISESTNTIGTEGILGNGVSHNANAAEAAKPVNDDISVNVDTSGAEKAVSDDGSYDSVNDNGAEKAVDDGFSLDPIFSWKEELECLVRGGVPKDLRGEVKLTLMS